jgi:hypothetical protein
MKTHNPFRKRSRYDRICVWFNVSGVPTRRYCTKTYRTREGALGLVRSNADGTHRLATAAHAAFIHPVILIEKLKP